MIKKILIVFCIIAAVGLVKVYADGHGYTTYDYPARVIVRDKIVEYDADRFIGAYGLYEVADGLVEVKQHERENSYKDEIELLQKQIELLKLQLQLRGGEVDTKDDMPPEKDKFASITSLFISKCSKCHGDTKQDGGLQLIKDGRLVDIDATEANAVFIRTYFSEAASKAGLARMPKGSPALSNEEMNIIDEWLVNKSLGE